MKQLSLIIAFVFFASNLIFAQTEWEPLGNWFDETLPASFGDLRINEVWGVVNEGKEYAVVGTTMGTHFLDLTDPTHPTQVAYVQGKFYGSGVVHRDYKHYQNYLYAVCDEGPSSLQVIDYSYLPDSVHVVYDSDQYTIRAHNCWVDTSRAILYTCGVNGGTIPFQMFDISNPAQPVFLVSAQNFETGEEIPYVHDLYVRNDTAFLNCGFDGMYVAECSDPSAIKLLGTLTNYPQKGYNHSGWWDAAGQYYYLADETHGMDLKTVKTTDLTDLSVKALFDADSPEQLSIPHNLIVRDSILYVSYYYDGLQVYDVRDPENPQRIFYYDTYAGQNTGSYMGAWGVYPLLPSGLILLSDMQSGLYVFPKVSLPVKTSEAPEVRSLELSPNPVHDRLSIRLEGEFKRAMLEIHDLTGKSFITKKLPSLPQGVHHLTIDEVSVLPAGVYPVYIRSQNKVWQGKFVKQ